MTSSLPVTARRGSGRGGSRRRSLRGSRGDVGGSRGDPGRGGRSDVSRGLDSGGRDVRRRRGFSGRGRSDPGEKELALTITTATPDSPFSRGSLSGVRNIGSGRRSELNDDSRGGAVRGQGDLADRLGSGGDNASDGRGNRGGFFAVLGKDFSVVRGLGRVDGGSGGVGGKAGSAVVGSDGQGLVGQQRVAAVLEEGGVVLSAAVQGLVSDVVLLVLLEVTSGPTGGGGLGGRRRGDRDGSGVGDGQQGDDGGELSEHAESR
jgi:hypothetical protein